MMKSVPCKQFKAHPHVYPLVGEGGAVDLKPPPCKRKGLQPRRRQQREHHKTHKTIGLSEQNKDSARTLYILVYFFSVLCKTRTWYDQFHVLWRTRELTIANVFFLFELKPSLRIQLLDTVDTYHLVACLSRIFRHLERTEICFPWRMFRTYEASFPIVLGRRFA